MANKVKYAKTHIILLLLIISGCNNVEKDNSKIEILRQDGKFEQKNEPKLTIESTDSIIDSEITYQREHLNRENDKRLTLIFTKIDLNAYLDYKQKYSNEITIDPTINNEAGSFFMIPVKSVAKKFNCDIEYKNYTYYKGFLEPLNKYILTHCGNGYCVTYLLDKNTGSEIFLKSPFDTECEIPLISKDKNKLIAFSSSVFDREAYIALYKKDTESQKYNFKELKAFSTLDWRIKEIIWIDNNSIALEIYDKYGGKSGDDLINPRYLIGKIE